MKYVTLEKVVKIDRTTATDVECATLPYVGLEHIEKDTGHLVDDFVGNPETLLATKFKFTPKHVLYGKLRPYLNKVVLPTFSGVCTTEILPLLPLEKELDRIYLWAILQSSHFVTWASSNISGANLPRLDPKLLATYQLPLPPLPEQKRIAAILEKADRLRRQCRYALELSNTYLQSVFLEMFGDPLNNPKGWNTLAVETLLSTSRAGTQTGPFGSSLKRHEYVKTGIPVWGINNIRPNEFVEKDSLFITPEKYNDLTSYSVEAGDILVSRAGTVGRMCVAYPIQHPSIIGTNLVRISLNSSCILPEYFVALFTYFPERVGRLRMSHDNNAYSFLNPTILRTLEIPVPPVPLQERFVAIADQQRRILVLNREAERQAEHLFQTLLHQAFEGDVGLGSEMVQDEAVEKSVQHSVDNGRLTAPFVQLRMNY